MAHELERMGDTYSFYALRTPGWHNLGTVVEEAVDIDQALRLANMEWDFSLEPITTTHVSLTGVTTIEVPNKRAVVRTRQSDGDIRALGVVGDRFVVHTPREMWSFIDGLVAGGAEIETLGALGIGERAFITLKLPSHVMVGGQDQTDLYLFCSTAFDGSQATRADLTGVRVVCANTWRAGQRASQAHLSIRHTSSLDSRADIARRILDIAVEYEQFLADLGNRLYGTSIRHEDAAQVVSALFPFPEEIDPTKVKYEDLSAGAKRTVTRVQETRGRVFSMYTDSPVRAETGTAWGLYQAVTEWADWASPVRGEDRDNARAEKVLLGEVDAIKDRALELLLVG